MQKIAANCRCEGARGKTGKYFGFDIDGCSEVVHIFRVCSILVHLLILEFICQNKELCILLTKFSNWPIVKEVKQIRTEQNQKFRHHQRPPSSVKTMQSYLSTLIARSNRVIIHPLHLVCPMLLTRCATHTPPPPR